LFALFDPYCIPDGRTAWSLSHWIWGRAASGANQDLLCKCTRQRRTTHHDLEPRSEMGHPGTPEGWTTAEEEGGRGGGPVNGVCGASANARPEQGFGIKARMQRATPPTCPAAESATAQPRMPAPRRACVWHSRRPGQWRLCTALAASHCTMRFVGRTGRAIGIAPLRAGLDRARRDRDALDRAVASISFHARPLLMACDGCASYRPTACRLRQGPGASHRIASPAPVS
jgi:hypothetical protein